MTAHKTQFWIYNESIDRSLASLNISTNGRQQSSLHSPPSQPQAELTMSPATSTSSTMASKALIPIFVVMMLISGVCNTLLSKYQVRPFHSPPESLSPLPLHTRLPDHSLTHHLLGLNLRPQLHLPRPLLPRPLRAARAPNRPDVRRRNRLLVIRGRLPVTGSMDVQEEG